METLLITKLTIINPIYSLFRINYSVKTLFTIPFD